MQRRAVPSAFLCVLIALISSSIEATVLVEYEIDTVSNSEVQAPLGPTYHNGSQASITASVLGLSGVPFDDVPGTGDYYGSHWRTDGSFGGVNEYYEFSVEGVSGRSWTPSKISFALVQHNHSNFIGPAYWLVRASTDDFASVDVGIPIDEDPPHLTTHDFHFLRTLTDFSALGSGPFEKVTFRLYGWNSTHSGARGGLANSNAYPSDGQNLIIEGTVEPAALIEYEIDTVSNSEVQAPLGPTYRNGSENALVASALQLSGVGFDDVPGKGDYYGSHWRTDGSFGGVNEYYEWKVSPIGGATWTPSRVSFSLVQHNHSNFIGPAYWLVRASTDDFASVDVGIPIDEDPPHLTTHDFHFLRTLTDFSALGPGPFNDVTFRLYGWNSTHSVARGGLANSNAYPSDGRNLVIEGTIPEPGVFWMLIPGIVTLAGLRRMGEGRRIGR